MIPPIIIPPAVPIIKAGANALVMIAAGKLSNAPKRRPMTHPAIPVNQRNPITSPIANRSMKAASGAALLSGNDIGSIIATETTPKTAPLIKPKTKFDMV